MRAVHGNLNPNRATPLVVKLPKPVLRALAHHGRVSATFVLTAKNGAAAASAKAKLRALKGAK